MPRIPLLLLSLLLLLPLLLPETESCWPPRKPQSNSELQHEEGIVKTYFDDVDQNLKGDVREEIKGEAMNYLGDMVIRTEQQYVQSC